jgi:hypothetical protein
MEQSKILTITNEYLFGLTEGEAESALAQISSELVDSSQQNDFTAKTEVLDSGEVACLVTIQEGSEAEVRAFVTAAIARAYNANQNR